jgi:hypothetical protein
LGIIVKLAASRELFSYWNLLRGQRSAPERAEVDPGAIRGVLADTFILEVDASRRYPLRVAGTRTNALFLRELRGAAFLDLWQAADQSEVTSLLADVTDDATPVLAGASTGLRGLQPLELELLLLPLRHRGNTHSRILGSCAPTSMPSWIGLMAAAPLKLQSFRLLGRVESPVLESASASQDIPTGDLGFGRARPVDRRGHLFVLSGPGQ